MTKPKMKDQNSTSASVYGYGKGVLYHHGTNDNCVPLRKGILPKKSEHEDCFNSMTKFLTEQERAGNQ